MKKKHIWGIKKNAFISQCEQYQYLSGCVNLDLCLFADLKLFSYLLWGCFGRIQRVYELFIVQQWALSCLQQPDQKWGMDRERDRIYLVTIVKQRKYLSSHKVRNPRPSDSALRCSTTELRIILWRARTTLGSRVTVALNTTWKSNV